MKTNSCAIILFILLAIISLKSQAQVNRLLDIPGRLQWDNANGYCGETSIQMIALYYGNYISQDICRTVAGGEVLFGNDNGEVVLNSFSFTIETWDYNQGSPQYQNYLVWLKQQLYQYHPVIITVFVQGMNDPYYDHIIPAIGFTSTDISTYHNSDQLMFHDCYESAFFTRTFQSIWDSRSMSGNGADYEYCIPREVNYGCAVTGIRDEQHITRPVRLAINRWDEPNVTLGEQAVLLNATITADSLIPGQKYALLRYDNYTHVPSTGFSPSGASSVVYFTATGNQRTFNASFMSNSAVFYRCIPYNYTSTEKLITQVNTSNLYPNPASDYLTIEVPGNASVEIINSKGQVVMQADLINSVNTVDIKALDAGIYSVRIKTVSETVVKKFVKRQ